VAVPGLVEGTRIVAAPNLGWFDVEAADVLGLPIRPRVVLNDAEAAALGESVLRDGRDIVFVGLGTGVGGAVVIGGQATAANLFGHLPGFSDRTCRCTRTGCLETVAAGWALPEPLPAELLPGVARALATAVRDEPLATGPLVVVTGGLARRYPALLAALAEELPDRRVEPSAAPAEVKSAAAWGLALAYEQVAGALA
jgi:predicted NBD/HSP70 family sugar kinase